MTAPDPHAGTPAVPVAPSAGAGTIFATITEAAAWAAALSRAGGRLVVTNGCFDLLHVGHVRYLRAARALGDALLVGLNSDRSVCALKGPGRPVVAQDERAEVLCALRWVDAAVIFDEPTAEALLEAVRPAVYAKGGDYAQRGHDAGGGPAEVDEARLPEARVVRAHGGRIVLLPYHGGHSTTALLDRLRDGS